MEEYYNVARKGQICHVYYFSQSTIKARLNGTSCLKRYHELNQWSHTPNDIKAPAVYHLAQSNDVHVKHLALYKRPPLIYQTCLWCDNRQQTFPGSIRIKDRQKESLTD